MSSTDIDKRLAALVVDSGLDAIPRRDDPLGWDDVWENLPYQPVAYSTAMIDYQEAYLRGAGWTVRDASLILRSGGRPCGLWPLTVGGPPGEVCLTSAGAAIMAPTFRMDARPHAVKRIVSSAILFARHFCGESGLPAIVCEQEPFPPLVPYGATEWHRQLLGAGAEVTVKHELYVDLAPDLAAIRANFRKSYKPLINAGLRQWKVFSLIDDNADEAVWAEFKRLHMEVAGRITRSDDTWAQQFAMIAAGQAFLIGLRDPVGGRLVGGGFFQYTRDELRYSVGAYDRAQFEKPLGHVVQQRAIEWMKLRGLRWYRVGQRFYPQESPRPTDKEVSIAIFKQGFASHVLCRYVFRLLHEPHCLLNGD